MAFMGVLISWLMFARKLLLAMVVASAAFLLALLSSRAISSVLIIKLTLLDNMPISSYACCFSTVRRNPLPG